MMLDMRRDETYPNGKRVNGVVKRSLKGISNACTDQDSHCDPVNTPSEPEVLSWNTKVTSFFTYIIQMCIAWMNAMLSCMKRQQVGNNMHIIGQGERLDGNIWQRGENVGEKQGYAMKQEFERNHLETIPHIFAYYCAKFDSTPCLGTRTLLQRHSVEEGSKTLEKLSLGDYQWKTYTQMNQDLCHAAAGLYGMGLRRGDRVAILAETRADLLTSMIGCFRAGLTVVTLYTNLTDSGLICGITETEVQTIITSFELLPRLVKILADCPKIVNIIVLEDQLAGIGDTAQLADRVNLIPYSQLLTRADLGALDAIECAQKDDTAIIMYTSGSTGLPKGVEITHKNILASMLAYAVAARVAKGDRYIAFLPLAHIMELVTEMALMALGATIAYSTPNTLTTSGTKIARGTLGDARVARPTVMTAVPLILDRIIKAITQKVEKEGKFKVKIFHKALETKQTKEHSLASKVIDIIIFKKVKSELGGRMKSMVVGGAPLSPQTHAKIRAMFGCTLQVGYGCTETTACATAMSAAETRTGITGPPNLGTFIKLEDWAEGGYLTSDKPYPRGEIIVGGDVVGKGYYKNESETEAAFYNENGTRWFRTGDIGMIDDSGVLKVVDRCKDLVKLNNGEYVSLGGVESKLKTNCLVENICVFVESGADYPVAVVVLNGISFMRFVKKCALPQDVSFEELCHNEQAAKMVLAEIQAHGKKTGLNRWDLPQAIHLSSVAWTPDNGFVTAALKLKRRVLQAAFKEHVLGMYAKLRQ